MEVKRLTQSGIGKIRGMAAAWRGLLKEMLPRASEDVASCLEIQKCGTQGNEPCLYNSW